MWRRNHRTAPIQHVYLFRSLAARQTQFAGVILCTSNSGGVIASDSDTFVLGFDICLVPGGNIPSGAGCSVLSAIPKLLMSLGTAHRADITRPGSQLCSAED